MDSNASNPYVHPVYTFLPRTVQLNTTRGTNLSKIAYIRLRKTSLYNFWEHDRCVCTGFYLSDNVTLFDGCSFRILLKCLRFRGDNNANIRCWVTRPFLFSSSSLNSFGPCWFPDEHFWSILPIYNLVLAIQSINIIKMTTINIFL